MMSLVAAQQRYADKAIDYGLFDTNALPREAVGRQLSRMTFCEHRGGDFTPER
jgi:hypothetical protein